MEKGSKTPLTIYKGSGENMRTYTVSDIIRDINNGCTANNMIEDKFSYRIIFFVRDGGESIKHYADSTYHNLRSELESIIRRHLTLTNRLVIAQTTVRMHGKCVCLQSKSYSFSLDEYFRQLSGTGTDSYNRYAVR